MNSIDFAFWLQGYFELSEDDQPLSKKQTQMIKNHLNLVFKHEIDTLYPGDPQELQDIHDGNKLNPDIDFTPEIDFSKPVDPNWPHTNRPNDHLIRC